MAHIILPAGLVEGDTIYNFTIVKNLPFRGRDTYRFKCNNCGHEGDIYNYGKGNELGTNRVCGKCKTRLYVPPIKETKNIVGIIEGDFTIISADKTHKTGRCKSGTEKIAQRTTKFKGCWCHKCNPNLGFHVKKYGNQWDRLLNAKDVFWTDYMHFESWIDSNLPQPSENHRFLRKINEDGLWEPENVWWSTSGSGHHISKWLEVLPKQDDITLLHELGKRLYFRCNKGHEFSRLKGSILNRSKHENYKVQCTDCLNEGAAKKRAKPKQVRLSLNEKVTRQHPTVSLIGDYKSKEEIGIFECSCCKTSYKMKISDLLRKLRCPICKSEEWAKFCDRRIKEKFGGKIIRTGVWTLAELETTWKCLKHGTHFKKSYDKILPSVTGGCPDCINFTVPDPNAPTRMYYVRLQHDNTHFYKIGITQNTVENRFDREIAKRKLATIKEWVYPTWKDAYNAEQAVIKAFAGEILCRGEKPLRNTESTEIFYWDVLELDNAKDH